MILVITKVHTYLDHILLLKIKTSQQIIIPIEGCDWFSGYPYASGDFQSSFQVCCTFCSGKSQVLFPVFPCKEIYNLYQHDLCVNLNLFLIVLNYENVR